MCDAFSLEDSRKPWGCDVILPRGVPSSGRTLTVRPRRCCRRYVFDIEGFITHMVVFRNGTPGEAADKFIHAVVPGQHVHVHKAAHGVDAVPPQL